MPQMTSGTDILTDLADLHKQATTAATEIATLRGILLGLARGKNGKPYSGGSAQMIAQDALTVLNVDWRTK